MRAVEPTVVVALTQRIVDCAIVEKSNSASRLFPIAAGLLCTALLCLAQPVSADVAPERTGSATLGAPQPHWFILIDPTGAYVFDGDDGDMLGKVATSDYTTTLNVDKGRGMIYAPGSYYSRGTYGERTDVVVFNRVDSLAPAAEVVIPSKLAAAGSGGNSDLIGGRFLGVYNMTPAMSVSIVDVETRKFTQEIETAGCALVHALRASSSFMQVCGDGTLQLVALDKEGKEANRVRSKKFFDVESDPVYDYAVPSKNGWILVSFAGQVFEVSFDNGIAIADAWPLLTEKDRTQMWQLGGRQPIAYNAETQTLFTLMHVGKEGVDSHEDAGTEIWAYNVPTRRRGYRIVLEDESAAMNVTADAKPLLLVIPKKPRTVLVFDARTGKLARSIDEAGFAPGLVRRF